MMTPQDYLDAARAHRIKPAEFGLWTIERRLNKPLAAAVLGVRRQTILWRATPATLHLRGEVVMDDSHIELRKHLPIWMNASGSVLITGLGLGCVVRGLLANPAVSMIDVIEIDRNVAKTIWPEFAGNARCRLHVSDALTWPIPDGAFWEYAWHDIHDDDGHLQHLHAQLMTRFRDHAGTQGAWAFPRMFKRLFGRRIHMVGGAKHPDRRRVARIGLTVGASGTADGHPQPRSSGGCSRRAVLLEQEE